MILTCEKCETRYLLPSSALAPDGRTVRCSVCKHEWYQEYEESDYREDDEEETVEPIPDSVKPLPEGSEVPSLEIRDEEAPFPWASVAATAVLFLGIFGALVLLRGPITNIWPQSGVFYAQIGMENALPGEGLIIDQLKAVVDYDNMGGEQVQISGAIMNLEDRDIDVPLMKVELLDESDGALASYFYDSDPASVTANGEIMFASAYETPDNLKSVRIGFTLNDEMPEPVEAEIEEMESDEDSEEENTAEE